MKDYIGKIFMNGRSQAIRLPKECRFQNTDTVRIQRDGDRLTIEPVYDNWQPILEALASFPDEVTLERSPIDISDKKLFDEEN